MNNNTIETAEVIPAVTTEVSVQKVMSILKKGIRGNLDIDASAALEILKKEGFVVLPDSSATLVSVKTDRGRFLYSIKAGAPAVESGIPSGEHAGTEDGTTTIYQTPSGTELMIIMQQLETLDNAGAEPASVRGDSDDDDDDDEDDKEQLLDEDLDDEDKEEIEERMRLRAERRGAKQLVISPTIYFQFLKSSLTANEQQNLMERLNKIRAMMHSASALGQTALYEELALQFAGIAREQEVVAIGCAKRLPEETIQRFMEHVTGRPVKYCEFKDFPRTVPAKIAQRIKQVQAAKVFDSYHILYVDYVGEKLETNKGKIRDKDPVLFGKLNYQPDTLYFIIDWIDQYCDITLEKIVEVMKTDDPEFKLDEVPEVDEAFIKSIIEDVEKRKLRLKKTDPRNYRRLMREEENEVEERRQEAEELLEQMKAQTVEGAKAVTVPVAKSFFRKFLNKAGKFLPFVKEETTQATE